MKHAIRCIRQALRHPGAAIRGAAEFRTDLTSHYDDPDVLAKVSRGLGEAMVGINVEEIAEPHRLASRGW